MSNYVICLKWTQAFEWYVVRCGSKNGNQKDMYFDEIRLRIQITITIIGSRVNVIGDRETV